MKTIKDPFIQFWSKLRRFYSNIPYETQKKIWGSLFVLPWVIGFAIFFAYPFILTIYYSFHTVELRGEILTTFIGFSNYVDAFQSLVIDGRTFSRILIESTQNLMINLPVVLIFSLFIAVLLNTKFKGRAWIRAIFFIPVIFNAAAIDIAMSGQFSNYMEANREGIGFFQLGFFQDFLMEMGLGRGMIGFLVTSVSRIFTIVNISGVQILVFLAALQAIPRHLYEAAEIEGATKYESFWKITFPMVSPMFLTVIVYTIVDTFVNSPVSRFISSVSDRYAYGMASALSIIFFAINFLILFVIYLVIRKSVFSYD
ncbi:MAG: carbohydrate ABC transporter permease [Candidatus Izemoplasmataceae bacterium]|uniref:carbohydrate ABC transporter permease n=1 Tax=Liberiplasma polymorphum TaxID=3374570 RepID=UPI00377644AA